MVAAAMDPFCGVIATRGDHSGSMKATEEATTQILQEQNQYQQAKDVAGQETMTDTRLPRSSQ